MMRWDVVGRWVRERGYRIGAEVGVQTGVMFLHLLRSCHGLALYGVDVFEALPVDAVGEDHSSFDLPGAEERLRAICEGRLPSDPPLVGTGFVVKGFSVDAARGFEDGSLDFVFIDADHREASVRADIAAWRPKVRPGGVLSGHDAEVVPRHPHVAGVILAVNALCPGWVAHPDNVWEWVVP